MNPAERRFWGAVKKGTEKEEKEKQTWKRTRRERCGALQVGQII